MQSKGLWIGILAFVVGVGGGAVGTYKWVSNTEAHREAKPHRAKISIARDACCPPGASESKDAHAEPGEDEQAEHGGHDEHEEQAAGASCSRDGKRRIKLTPEAMKRFSIELAEVAEGTVEQRVMLPAEIVLNADHVAHLVPRVTGMVREVRKSVGDRVEAGELLAVLDSRELAEAKAADLAAEARLKLAEVNLKRVEGLIKEKLVSERQLNEAQQSVEESRIAHIETSAKLHALGFTHDQLSAIPDTSHELFGRYEIRAPFAGTVIDKHATLGEVHTPSDTMFVLADLSTVWLDINIYAQDAARIRTGAKVRISLASNGQEPKTTEGTIFYVSPTIRENTRTGLARAKLDNADGLWRPGMFVTAEVTVGAEKPGLVIASEAVQTLEGRPVLFIETDKGFEIQPVTLGKADGRFTQVLSGVEEADRYVSSGAFILKAEAGKSEAAHEY